MAADYDAPRVTENDAADESLEELTSRRKNDAATAASTSTTATRSIRSTYPTPTCPVRNSPSA